MSAPARVRRAARRTDLPRYAVIMAGGHGRRFWPRSRRRVPKHLLPISGRRTLLQETVERLRPLFGWRRILLVTTAEHATEVRRQLPRVPAEHILVEPVARNTAACTALATEWVLAREPDAVVLVAPADHVIKDTAGLRRSISAACDLAARHECLVTFGIPPTRAETGYGYIEIGSAIDRHHADASWVRRFHEKPPAATARRYVNSGRHLWNSGMFVWRASVFHRALARCMPLLQETLAGLWAPVPGVGARAGRTRRGIEQRLRRAYRRVPALSVDVAVVQPLAGMNAGAPRVAVVRAGFDWNDVGSWVAMPELWGCDETGNAAIGRLLPIDASDSIVYSPERLVALVGVHDLIVVDSPDALLICARDRAQDVQRVTQELKERGWSRYL